MESIEPNGNIKLKWVLGGLATFLVLVFMFILQTFGGLLSHNITRAEFIQHEKGIKISFENVNDKLDKLTLQFRDLNNEMEDDYDRLSERLLDK